MSLFQIQNVQVVNEAKAGVPIHTGIGYLDHMLDQLNSHAQVGVGLEVLLDTPVTDDHNRLASQSQSDLLTAIGASLGKALKAVVWGGEESCDDQEKVSRFCCPLDEALVECVLKKPSSNGSKEGKLIEYALAPYGKYPATTGRSKIGELETAAIVDFWRALAKESHLEISLKKIRGDNGHHIVESSFKAFSRALRNLLDSPKLWEDGSENFFASAILNRRGTVERKTKETSIKVDLYLNGKSPDDSIKIETGIPVLNAFFSTLAQEAGISLHIDCKGDLWVDDHHTAEDVSIAVGQCLTQALGTKAGLNRMWVGQATLNDAQVEVTMDLSNRPCLTHNLEDTLGKTEYVGTSTDSPLSCEMLEHVLDSLVVNGHMTVHIVEKGGASVHDTVMCTAIAFGRALRICAMVDIRRAGQTASSKGTLSV
jgi:imidazoleglycerol-phosphate dehydratase